MRYRIGSVATLTGIKPSTLRAWERRYELLSPGRSDGGYRLYSERDVRRLARVKDLVDRGFKISEAADLVRSGASPLGPGNGPELSVNDVRAELFAALLALNGRQADRIAARATCLPMERQLDDVLLPMLHEVGHLWACGEATIAQEHFIAAFVRGKLISMLESLGGGSNGGREAVLAGAPDERHELGLLVVALNLAIRGWRITYLGLDVPAAEIGKVVRERTPELVCSSLLRPVGADECVRYARELRHLAAEETVVIVGGAGIPEAARGQLDRGLHLLGELSDALPVLEREPAVSR